MANQEQLDMLKQGGEVWNQGRKEYIGLQQIDLSGADLRDIDLYAVNFVAVDLRRANLHEADLRDANFTLADLSDADLSETYLFGTIFQGSNLSGTVFSRSTAGMTIFGDLDLRVARGLETMVHQGPSTIGIDTILRSQGMIPDIFLRSVGVPDTFIAYFRIPTCNPISYHACFISYSSKDEPFARRLYADLQSCGVRCWFAPEDLKIGAKIRPSIDESIRLYDKLLLVLSQDSVESQWVEQEVETALARERKEHSTVLFPIRLDKTVMNIEGGWPALIRRTRNIGDFSSWKRDDAYQKALEQLLRDLKAESSKPKE